MISKSRLFSFALILAVLVTLINTAQVQAGAEIIVNTTDDLYSETPQGYCSLRMAIVSANENRAVGSCTAGSASSADVIVLPTAGPYSLYRSEAPGGDTYLGDLDITQSVSIIGRTTNKASIKAEPTQLQDRIFHIRNASVVTFSNLSIEGGNATGAPGAYNTGRGGGILNESGTLTIQYSLITSNQGPTAGGAIENHSGSSITIKWSTIQNNSSSYGGGIFNDGNVTLYSSLIYSNTATVNGGGLHNNSNSAHMYLTNVTVSANQSPDGWGIFNQGGLEIKNSTFAYNSQSGGVNPGSALFIANTTTGFIVNTIVAHHDKNCVVAKTGFSIGNNLEDRDDCGFTTTGDKVNTSSGIAASLALNDGQTLNYALENGSGAINAGNNSYCPSDDQRGWLFLRNDGHCDIGSFEYGTVETKLNNKQYLPTIFR